MLALNNDCIKFLLLQNNHFFNGKFIILTSNDIYHKQLLQKQMQ